MPQLHTDPTFSWINLSPPSPPVRPTRRNQPRNLRPVTAPSAQLIGLNQRLTPELSGQAAALQTFADDLLRERLLSTADGNILIPARLARNGINGVLHEMDVIAPGIGALLGACWLMARAVSGGDHLLAGRLDEGLRARERLHPALLAAQLVLMDEVRVQLPETVQVLRRAWRAANGPGTDQLPGLLALRCELGHATPDLETMILRSERRMGRGGIIPDWKTIHREAEADYARTWAWLQVAGQA